MQENGLQSDVNFDGLGDIWNEMNVGLELNKCVKMKELMLSKANPSFQPIWVICEKHNHEPALDMEGHPYAQRLSDNENRLVVDLLKKNVKPQDILSTLKEKNPSNLSTIQTIYEARKKIRKTRHAETIIGKTTNGEASVSSSPPYTPPTFDANKMKQTVDHTKPFAISKLVQGFDSAKQGTFAGQVPMPCYKRSSSFQIDLTLTNPVKEVSNASMFMFDDKPEGPFFMKQFLEGDYSLGQSSGGQTFTALESRNVKDKNVCDFEINKKHDKGEYVGVQSDSGMEENKSSDVNYNGFADIWKNMTAGLGSSKSMVVKDRMNTQCDTESTRADDKNERQFPVSSTSEFCTDMMKEMVSFDLNKVPVPENMMIVEDEEIIVDEDSCSEKENKCEPFVGQCFLTEEDAFVFYKNYARMKGFSIRKGRSDNKRGERKRRDIFCHYEGKPKPKVIDYSKQQRNRGSVRRDCKAHMRIKLRKVNQISLEQWQVTKFVKEHNHALLSTHKSMEVKDGVHMQLLNTKPTPAA
ncbi:protein FAR1-related sequence 11, partial [Tanacetum coccineum]